VDIPSGAHFVWPIGYDLGGVRLTWASAQPAGRLRADGLPTAVFAATAGVPPQFAFPAGTTVTGAEAVDHDGGVLVTLSGAATFTAHANGTTVRLLVLSETDALRLQRLAVHGVDTLVLCDDPVVADGDELWVDTTSDVVEIEFLPAPEGLHTQPPGPFWRWRQRTPAAMVEPAVSRTGGEPEAGPARTGGPRGRASAPLDEDFAHVATYHVAVPAEAFDGVTELLLELTYTGDVARAYVDGELVADHFWYGPPWQLGLARFAPAVVDHGLEIRILRKPEGSAVYVDPSVRTRYNAALETAVLEGARLLPVRRVAVRP
jgi:beta-galactosidase